MARRPKILSDADRQWFEGIGGKSWTKTVAFRARQGPRYTKTLDTFVDAVAKLGVEDPLDGARLRGLLEVMLSKDRSFGSYFRDRQSAVLEADEGWERLWSVCAGALVERHLAAREAPPQVSAALIFDEALREEIGELIELAIREGELSARAGAEAKEELITPGGAPDLIEAARARLEELFSADINIAHKSVADGIPDEEREIEIAKGALLDLQTTRLREIAEAEELPTLGKREAIATLIARKYKADRTAIAELILRYAIDDPERGHATRLLPLVEKPNLAIAGERLQSLRGSYLRIGVANWVVFEEARAEAGIASFNGEVRYYNIGTQQEGGDGVIAARQRKSPISVRLREGQVWAEVDSRNLTEVRRIRAAFAHATGVEAETTLPVEVPPLHGEAATLDRTTLLMLHLLGRLRDPHLDFASFTMASFSAPADPGAEADPLRPSVKQVRLSGEHLLSSRDACRLIADGQRMLAVEFRARYKRDLSAAASHFSTVQIGLAPDHASVLTSFGGDSSASRALHTDLVSRVRKGLDRGVPDPAALAGIVSQVMKRAAEAGEAETVDILAPEQVPEPIAAEEITGPATVPEAAGPPTTAAPPASPEVGA